MNVNIYIVVFGRFYSPQRHHCFQVRLPNQGLLWRISRHEIMGDNTGWRHCTTSLCHAVSLLLTHRCKYQKKNIQDGFCRKLNPVVNRSPDELRLRQQGSMERPKARDPFRGHLGDLQPWPTSMSWGEMKSPSQEILIRIDMVL